MRIVFISLGVTMEVFDLLICNIMRIRTTDVNASPVRTMCGVSLVSSEYGPCFSFVVIVLYIMFVILDRATTVIHGLPSTGCGIVSPYDAMDLDRHRTKADTLPVWHQASNKNLKDASNVHTKWIVGIALCMKQISNDDIFEWQPFWNRSSHYIFVICCNIVFNWDSLVR